MSDLSRDWNASSDTTAWTRLVFVLIDLIVGNLQVVTPVLINLIGKCNDAIV